MRQSQKRLEAMTGASDPQISASALAEVQEQFKVYCTCVLESDLTPSSQNNYLNFSRQFVRWLAADFVPGSRKEPYR